jgi:hypothetical protein
MNEEAILDGFKYFVSTGYNGTIEDYKQLINSNPEALSDTFKYFASTGYKGNENDFSILMGVKKKDVSEPVGTTEVTTESTTEDTSSDSVFSNNLQEFEKQREEEVAQRQAGEYDFKPKSQDVSEDKFGIYDTEPLKAPSLDESPEIVAEKINAYNQARSKKLEEIRQNAIEKGIIEPIEKEISSESIFDYNLQESEKQKQQEAARMKEGDYDFKPGEITDNLFGSNEEYNQQIKELYEKIPNLEQKIQEEVNEEQSLLSVKEDEEASIRMSEFELINEYDKLSDEIKQKIEPALKKENGEIVGVDYSLLSKDVINELIEETKKTTRIEGLEEVGGDLALLEKRKEQQDLIKNILENYAISEGIEYKQKAKKAGELQKEIKNEYNKILDLEIEGFFNLSDKLKVNLYDKTNEYNEIAKGLTDKSIILNAAQIAADNEELTTVESISYSAIESFGTNVVKLAPSLVATGAKLVSFIPGVDAERTEKIMMNFNKEASEFIKESIPTDYDDVKANFVGDVVGQIGFVAGGYALGGTPLAMSAAYSMSMSEMYEEAIANGLEHNDAMNLSIAYGGISAPLEMIPLKGVFGRLGGKSIRRKVLNEILEKGAKGFTKEFAENTVKLSLAPIIKETLKEAAEEGLQEGTQYLLSKGLAETYNALKDEDKAEFIKAQLGSKQFFKELVQNIVLGAVGGAIGGVSLNALGGNIFVGKNYKAMEEMFTDPKQMAKITNQLNAYRKNGTIKTDEELQLVKEQVGIVQSAAAEVMNATKGKEFSSVTKKKLFELTAERLSVQKEIDGVATPSLVADKKQRIADIDKNIEDIVSGKITDKDIIAEQVAEEKDTEEQAVDEFVVTEEEYKNFVDNGEVSEETISNIADIVQEGKEISDEKTLAIYTDKVSEINKILSDRKDAEEAAPEAKVELEQAKTPGEQITTTEEQTLFKGMQPKIKDGKPFSAHKIEKGEFAAADKKLASDYKGDKPLKKFTVPPGTTIDVVKVEDTNQPLSEVKKQEEKLIDDSDAQVVKLITRDARGTVEEQYIIKDDSILETAEDIIEEEVAPEPKQVRYEMNKTDKRIWRKDFEIIDNRDGKTFGPPKENGRWIVENKVTGLMMNVSTKKEAQYTIDNAPGDPEIFGEGQIVDADRIITPETGVEITEEVKPEAEAAVKVEEEVTEEVKPEVVEDSKIKEAKSKLPQAKKNIKKKIGAAVDVGPLLDKLFAVNPNIVPKSVFNEYLDVLDVFSKKGELSPPEVQEVIKKAENLLNEIGEQSIKEPKKQKGKKKESKEEKKQLINDAKKSASTKNPKFSLEEETALAKELKKFVKSKAIDKLSVNELKTLNQVLNNLNNGWINNTTQVYTNKLKSIENTVKAKRGMIKGKLGRFTEQYSKFKSSLSLSGKGNVQKALESIPKYYIDQALSVAHSTDLFDSILRGLAEAEQLYTFQLRALDERLKKIENEVLESLKDPNKAIISSAKQMVYILNLEYKSNQGNVQVNPVIDFINETINKEDIDVSDRKILEDIKQKFFDGNNLKEKELFDSFNNAEKNSIKEVQKINEELSSLALFTAGVIRGDRISLLNNYVHHVVIDDKFDGSKVMNVESQVKSMMDSRKPDTKAKSLIERTGAVTALNFDIYNSVSRGAKYTYIDYHLTNPILVARETLQRTKQELKEEGNYLENENIFKGINGLLEKDIEITLVNNIASSSIGERIASELAKFGYQKILVNTGRLIRELSSNMAFIILRGQLSFIEGTKYISVMQSDLGPEVMEAVKSLQLNRTYQTADMNSRFVEKYENDLSGIRGKKTRGAIINRAAQIHTASTKKLKNKFDKVAGAALSTPDKIMNRPLWFGSFALEFKKQSGVEVNFEKIAAKDKDYFEKHEEAIEKAKRKADDTSIEAAASEGLFTGISKGKDWKTEKDGFDRFLKFAFSNFNGFMNRFLVYEYTAFAKGWAAARGNGTLTKREGVFLMAAVSSRMYLYSLIASTTTTGVIGIIFQALGISEEEEEDDEKLSTKALRAGAQTIVNLGQRNFGNATRAVINWGVEYANENYLDVLRDGEFDKFKNSIVYKVQPYKDSWVVPFAGPYSPIIKTAILAKDIYDRDDLTDKGAIERRQNELFKRLPLEVLGSIGYLPASNEIIKEVNRGIYKDLNKASKGKYVTPTKMSDKILKQISPELYNEMKIQEKSLNKDK